MAENKLQEFRKMSDADLANYYVDVCAYREHAAVEQQKAIREIIVERFIEKFADKRMEHNCPDCFFYNAQLDQCDRLGGCRYD